MTILAITGGTGFVGTTTIDLARAQGHQVRALTRRAQPARDGVRWIEGSLETPDALARLVEGADAVLHIAGAVNAPDRAGFARANIAGTEAALAAARGAGVQRFVHVSSLSAREPQLSNYGWSKAEAEVRVAASPLAWTMVRPPAIYGPGDMDMFELFRLARHGLAVLPSHGRMSAIHVADLARLLLALAAADAGRVIYEADDGTPGGWSHRDFARAIGTAVGRKPLTVTAPRALIRAGAAVDRLVRGPRARLTPDRVAYMTHPDWVIDPKHRPPAELWQPAISTPEGLATTAAWYRAQGLL